MSKQSVFESSPIWGDQRRTLQSCCALLQVERQWGREEGVEMDIAKQCVHRLLSTLFLALVILSGRERGRKEGKQEQLTEHFATTSASVSYP